MILLGYMAEKYHQSITEVSPFALFTGYFMPFLKCLCLNSPMLANFLPPRYVTFDSLNALPKNVPSFGHSMPNVWATSAQSLFGGLSRDFCIMVILW